MITCNHTFKITGGVFSQCAEIDMNHHEHRQDKSGCNMYQIGNVNAAFGENLSWYVIREQ